MAPTGLLLPVAGLLLVTAILGVEYCEDYYICIKTGVCAGAGTDAEVKIRLHGQSSYTEWVELNDPNRDDFERGSNDCFPFRAKRVAPQVEDIQYIEVKQFQDAEKWCIKHINLTFNGTTKQYGETGWIENVIKNSTATCFSGTEQIHVPHLLLAVCAFQTLVHAVGKATF